MKELENTYGYSNTGVADDIIKGSSSEYDLGRQRIADANKDIKFSPEWYQDKWKNGETETKGKVGAILSGLSDAASGLRGMNFNMGQNSAGGNTRTGQVIENANQDYRQVGQAAAEDAMGLQKMANQNEATRHEAVNTVNQGLRQGSQLEPDQIMAIENWKNALGDPSIGRAMLTAMLNLLGIYLPSSKTSKEPSPEEPSPETPSIQLSPEEKATQSAVNAGQSVSKPQTGLQEAKERQLLEERLRKRSNATDKKSYLETFKNPVTGRYELPSTQDEIEGLASQASKYGIKSLEKELEKLNRSKK